MKQVFAVMLFLFVVISAAAAEEKRFTISVGDSPQKGPKDASVTIIEFLDFQ
ncbi:MAG: hypothetical protein HZA15_01795 [Nitrospirae bacterium]|nr:hypothetical protein [Nitrospirota bacterium]